MKYAIYIKKRNLLKVFFRGRRNEAYTGIDEGINFREKYTQAIFTNILLSLKLMNSFYLFRLVPDKELELQFTVF